MCCLRLVKNVLIRIKKAKEEVSWCGLGKVVESFSVGNGKLTQHEKQLGCCLYPLTIWDQCWTHCARKLPRFVLIEMLRGKFTAHSVADGGLCNLL
jgi:hypothetical protein